MTQYLSLPKGVVLHVQGWNYQANATLRYQADFIDPATVSVSRERVKIYGITTSADREIARIGIENLTIIAGTNTATGGGTFIGGGFGVRSAAEGMMEAAVLNALTSASREYACLGLCETLPNGAERSVVLGYRKITESDLRDKLTEALPRWSSSWLERMLGEIPNYSRDEALGAYSKINVMRKRGVLSDTQHARIHAAVEQVAPEVSSTSGSPGSAERIDGLKTLAELRDSGALTTEEFEAEKARLLRG